MSKESGNQEVEIARCHKGQYFGELALVTNKPRAASAYAVGDVKCLGKKIPYALILFLACSTFFSSASLGFYLVLTSRLGQFSVTNQK